MTHEPWILSPLLPMSHHRACVPVMHASFGQSASSGMYAEEHPQFREWPTGTANLPRQVPFLLLVLRFSFETKETVFSALPTSGWLE